MNFFCIDPGLLIFRQPFQWLNIENAHSAKPSAGFDTTSCNYFLFKIALIQWKRNLLPVQDSLHQFIALVAEL